MGLAGRLAERIAPLKLASVALRTVGACAVLVVLIESTAAAQWNIQTIATTTHRTSDTSIAMDGAGRPVVAYTDPGLKTVHVAAWTGSGWHYRQFSTAPYWAEYNRVAVAVDAQGNPWVAFDDSPTPHPINDNRRARIARWDGQSWSIDTFVDRNSHSPSVALSQSGAVGVTFSDDTAAAGRRVVYAQRNAAGGWAMEAVAAEGSFGGWTSLQYDAQGTPKVAFYDRDGHLKYAERTANGWAVETIDSGYQVGRYCDLALDSLGQPVISYAAPDSDQELLVVQVAAGQSQSSMRSMPATTRP